MVIMNHSSSNQSRDIMQALQRVCKSQGLTQVRISDYLGVSLPTVKRWFSGHGVSLDVFNQLLALTGTSFEDLAALVATASAETFQYTIKQEEFLAEHLGHLAYFDQLINGHSPNSIKRKHRLTDHSQRRYLKDLDAIGLIERHPGDEIVVVPKGAPKWRPNGPLDRAVGSLAVSTFIEESGSDAVTLHLHKYSDEDRIKIKQMIDELSSYAQRANRRAKISGIKDRGFGLLVGLSKFELKALKEIPNI